MSLRNKTCLFSSKDAELQAFFERHGAVVTHDPFDNPDFAIFTPGEDVSPFLYGSLKIPSTHSNYVRDMKENKLYRELKQHVPKIGIGRGAQFLCVMAGGTLWQHVTGHAANHYVVDMVTGEHFMVTSYHHQEMVLPDGADVMAATNVANIKKNPFGELHFDLEGNDKAAKYNDIEVGYIDSTSAMCFQPRPEKGHKTTEAYFLRCLDDCFNLALKA